LLDNVAISKEKERLLLENAQLQDLIQQVETIILFILTMELMCISVSCVQYISGTQLNQDTLSDDNPLFVVNGR
jgi:hypothetical protein